tara:strand:- start:611 stop:853 length:243 start_codon:yes stop_codon:yes gene_type:complete
MEFLDTPNPNAKKVLINHDLENAIYLDNNISTSIIEISNLLNMDGIENIFTGPGFITITKKVENSWESIIENINSNLDNI